MKFDNEEGVCKCIYNYYYNSNSNEYICFAENEDCNSKGYNYKDMNGNECFTSLEDCKTKGKKKYLIINVILHVLLILN